MIRAKNAFAAPLIAVVLLLVLAAAAQASVINVTVTSDPSGPNDCGSQGSVQCSLRQAIAVAQPGDTIQLAGTSAHPVTYTLTQAAPLDVQTAMTIVGGGDDPGATIIDDSHNIGGRFQEPFRTMRIDQATVSISQLTFANGIDANDEQFQSCSPCETNTANGGGALFNNGGNVTLSDVVFSGEPTSANSLGGAVSNGSGTLDMTDVSFNGNDAAFGGALFVRGGTVTGNGVTFEKNDGEFGGGTAYLAGGIVSFTNTTVVGDSRSAAFANRGATLTLVNDTFSGDSGGTLQTDFGQTRVANTILGPATACVAAGRDDAFDDSTTSTAITTDDGNNLDPGSSCHFDGNGDIADADPHLASIADNGGPTRTQALLSESQALRSGNSDLCPPTDQRGVARPEPCDIGAFEAQAIDPPSTPTTGQARNITDSSADLTGTINLSGEAGGFYFLWGTDPGNLNDQTAVQGAGIVPHDTSVTQTLSGLASQTTYFYKIVADNSTDSAQAGADDIHSFTTTPPPPSVFGAFVDSVTDTTGTVDLTVDPNGTGTSVVVKYGPTTAYGQQTAPIDVGSGTAGVERQVTLTGLTPNTDYHFDVVASNQGGSNDSGDQELVTDKQVSGTSGTPVMITDSGTTFQDCPTTATVQWGDGANQTFVPSCTVGDPNSYQLSASHTYASPGHFHVVISYPDLDQSNIDQFAVISQPPASPQTARPGSNPPPASKPLAVTGPASRSSATSAAFDGSVNPGGLSTTAHFEYGLDSKYTSPGTSGPVYDKQTPSQGVGSDSNSHAVSATVSGLVPNALYHVRLVATNSDGTTLGPDQTFTTPAAPAPGAPTIAKSVNIVATQGVVLIEIGGKLVPITQLKQIPAGSVIDALHGTLNLITSTGTGHKTQTGTFGGAIFKVTQDHTGLTTLTLVENAFKGAPSYASCNVARGKASAAALSAKTLQLLKGKDNHGKFRTKGRYAAATTRGTAWSVADRCDGTLTKVTQSSVLVNDFVRHVSLILHAGHSYLALAKPPRHK